MWIVFKNLYPKDFADLQMEKGIAKIAFEDKRTYIASKQTDLQTYIDASSKLIEKVKNDVLKSSNELKFAMMSQLTGWRGYVKYVERDRSSKSTAKEIMDMDFDLSDLCIAGRWYVGYSEWQNTSTLTIYPDDFTDICEEYLGRLKRLKELEEKKLSGIQKQIDISKQRKYLLLFLISFFDCSSDNIPMFLLA